jgi:hypothetical protein
VRGSPQLDLILIPSQSFHINADEREEARKGNNMRV